MPRARRRFPLPPPIRRRDDNPQVTGFDYEHWRRIASRYARRRAEAEDLLHDALLDATRSGIVLSSIHHRDQARLYAKQVRDGQAELELSPEEAEAVRLALAGEVQEAPR